MTIWLERGFGAAIVEVMDSAVLMAADVLVLIMDNNRDGGDGNCDGDELECGIQSNKCSRMRGVRHTGYTGRADASWAVVYQIGNPRAEGK